jgi:hypothetical protein
MTKLRSDGECHCGRDLDRGEAVSLHHVINWDSVSFRVSLLVVDERAAASLGVPPIATCPDLMPSVQLNRRDLGARGKQSGHDAMQIRRMKDPGNQQNIDTSLSRMIGHRAYIRLHHCFRPLIDPPRPMEPESVNVDPLNEIRASLGKLHQAPGGRGLANTRGSAQKHYAHRPRLHGSNDRDHQLNGAGLTRALTTTGLDGPGWLRHGETVDGPQRRLRCKSLTELATGFSRLWTIGSARGAAPTASSAGSMTRTR